METIVSITEFHEGTDVYGHEAGFKIETTQQEIRLAIDDESSCCERWGYFISEDDTQKFVGAELLGIEITDTNRVGRTFGRDYSSVGNDVELDDGNVMFVDVKTSEGTLQFAAYNAHNGYYGHQARVSSTQLNHSETL